jgi:hypothetical protein
VPLLPRKHDQRDTRTLILLPINNKGDSFIHVRDGYVGSEEEGRARVKGPANMRRSSTQTRSQRTSGTITRPGRGTDRSIIAGRTGGDASRTCFTQGGRPPYRAIMCRPLRVA